MAAILIDLKTIAPVMILVLVGLLVWLRRKQKRSIGYLLCFAVFYVYMLYVVKFTFMPMRLFDAGYTEWMQSEGATWASGLNLVPFRDVSVRYLLSVQGVGNVLLTMPFGFGLPFLSTRVSLRSIAWRGVLCSVAIEMTQLLMNVVYGYPHRTVDVNDVWLNVAGAVAGFLIFRLAVWGYRRVAPAPERVAGVWGHMHTVLNATYEPGGAVGAEGTAADAAQVQVGQGPGPA